MGKGNKNREACRVAELLRRRTEKEQRMKNPEGTSEYAKKKREQKSPFADHFGQKKSAQMPLPRISQQDGSSSGNDGVAFQPVRSRVRLPHSGREVSAAFVNGEFLFFGRS